MARVPPGPITKQESSNLKSRDGAHGEQGGRPLIIETASRFI
jgi:hypothetical protein